MMEVINKEVVLDVLTNESHPRHFLVRQVEKALIEEALIIHRGNQTKAAEAIGMSRTILRQRLKEFKQA